MHTYYLKPLKFGSWSIRQISSQLLSISHRLSGFGSVFCKPTPPVRKNRNSSWFRSPRALEGDSSNHGNQKGHYTYINNSLNIEQCIDCNKLHICHNLIRYLWVIRLLSAFTSIETVHKICRSQGSSLHIFVSKDCYMYMYILHMISLSEVGENYH